jgi:hypothetical protein
VEEALAVDETTNTTFWHDAIKKEMKNVMIAFVSWILVLNYQ